MNTITNVERAYDDEGNLLVLISPGCGCGWGTWFGLQIAFDKRIVEYFLNNHPSKEEMSNFMDDLGYNIIFSEDAYRNLTCVHIPRGRKFCIMEYDGSEYIITDEYLIEA